MNLYNYFYLARKYLYKRNSLPEQITLFVSNKCNCYCKHCFLWKDLNKNIKTELSLNEIKKISLSLDRFAYLLISGGEPFLNNNLSKIINIFYKNNNVLISMITSNGFFTKRILKTVENILSYYKNTLVVSVSFDEIGKKHDEIRGKKGVFKKAVKTHQLLEKISEKHLNLKVGIIITMSPFNQNRFKDIYIFKR